MSTKNGVLKVISVAFYFSSVFAYQVKEATEFLLNLLEDYLLQPFFFGWCAELWSGGRRTCRTCSYGPALTTSAAYARASYKTEPTLSESYPRSDGATQTPPSTSSPALLFRVNERSSSLASSPKQLQRNGSVAHPSDDLRRSIRTW